MPTYSIANNGSGEQTNDLVANSRMAIGHTTGDTWSGHLVVNGDAGVGTTSPNKTGFQRALTIATATGSGTNRLAGVELCGTKANDTSDIGHVEFYGGDTISRRLACIIGAHDGADTSGLIRVLTTNSGSITEKMRITSGGNVGIGTTDPSAAKLVVNGDCKLQSGAAINEFSTDGTLGDNSDTAVPTEKAVKTYVGNQGGGLWNRNSGSGYTYLGNSGDSVGIGTSTPSAKLHINTQSTAVHIGNDTNYATQDFGSLRMHTASTAIVDNYSGSLQLGGGGETLTIATNLVSISADTEIAGYVKPTGGYKSSDGASTGGTSNVTVRNAAGTGTTTLVFKNGLFISAS